MVPRWSLVLGVKSAPWDHRGTTPLSWARSQAWSGDHDGVGPPLVSAPTHDGPARSDGARGRGQASRLRAATSRTAARDASWRTTDRPAASRCRRLRYCEGEARRGATRGHGEGKKREQGEAHGTDDGRVLAARRHRRGVRRVGGRRRSDRDGGLRGEEAAHGVCKWSNMDQSLAPFAGTVVLLSSEPSERWQGLVLPL